jgi:hypothetical protein
MHESHNCQFCGELTDEVTFFGKDWSCLRCLYDLGIEEHPANKFIKYNVEVKEIPCDNKLYKGKT